MVVEQTSRLLHFGLMSQPAMRMARRLIHG
jgi:hypothetical protein